jgi:Fic family protein
MKSTLEILTSKYTELSKSFVDLDRLNLYLMSHHSTSIEGSTLTIVETEIFLEKGLTAKSKPLEYHLMVKNHFEALQYVIDIAKKKGKIDSKLIQRINVLVMQHTGTIHNTQIGSFDSSKGDLRLLNVRTGASGDSYMNYDKVPAYLKELCKDVNSKIDKASSIEEINELAFMTHYQLVTIHPFVDGSGRTSRLLMNYIQSYHGQPMTIVFEEDRQQYIESLIATRKEENIQLFLDFMESQHLKFLNNEIKKLTTTELPKKKSIGNIGLVF